MFLHKQRLTALFLAGMVCLLSACGGKQPSPQNPPEASSTPPVSAPSIPSSSDDTAPEESVSVSASVSFPDAIPDEPENPRDNVVRLDSAYVELACSYQNPDPADVPFQGDCLQFGYEHMLYRTSSYFKEDYSVFDMVNLNTGEIVYSFEIDSGRVDRIEKTRYDVYDYRIFSRSSVIYRSSGDPELEFFYTLPEYVRQRLNTKYSFWQNNVFDVNVGENLVTYAGDDGVYLASLTSPETQNILVLPNANLPEVVGHPYTNKDQLQYINARFVGESRYIAAIIDLPGAQSIIGLSLIDTETREVTHYTDVFGAMRSQYHIHDGKIITASDAEHSVIDPENPADVKRIPFDPAAYTYTLDGETFIYDEVFHNEKGVPTTLLSTFTADSPEDTQPFISATGERFIIAGCSENYILCQIDDSTGLSLIAIRYR